MINGLVSAVRTLTIVRVPGEDAARHADALPWFPLVGAAIGVAQAVAGLLVLGAGASQWVGLAALTMLLTGTVLTGGLHIDGFADWADSLGARGDRARALDIMKDSRIGVFGAIAVGCLLLTKWVAYVQLVEQYRAGGIVVAVTLSRLAQVWLAVQGNYAREEGTAGAIIGEAGARDLRRAAVLAGILLVVLTGGDLPALLLLSAVAAAVAAFWAVHCRGRYGGVTGDLLGAGSEWVEATVLLAAGMV